MNKVAMCVFVCIYIYVHVHTHTCTLLIHINVHTCTELLLSSGIQQQSTPTKLDSRSVLLFDNSQTSELSLL